jgi:hypothetical protein
VAALPGHIHAVLARWRRAPFAAPGNSGLSDTTVADAVLVFRRCSHCWRLEVWSGGSLTDTWLPMLAVCR